MNNKWLVVSTHDERNDFNLNMSWHDGTIEEFEMGINEWVMFDKSDRTCVEGVYIYRHSNREEYNEELEVVRFEVLYLIPFSKLLDNDFMFSDGIVCRNMKFGFLDKR